MNYSVIVGTGSFLPNAPVTNDRLPAQLQTSDSWIVERTGIRSRHFAGDMSPLEMAAKASTEALTSARIEPRDVDLIVAATISGDMIFPSLAALLQERLGCRDIGAFDIAAACSGFVYGLGMADAMVVSGKARNVLLVAAEKMSRLVNPRDRGTYVLFGDGAGAVVVSKSKFKSIRSIELHSRGGMTGALHCAPALGSPYIHMIGPAVFKVAVKTMTEAVRSALSANELSVDDVDLFLPHQANLRIIEAVADAVGFPMSKVLVTLGEHANVSAASIPLALDHAVRNGRMRDGDVVLMAAVGGGLTWAVALLEWGPARQFND